MMSTFSVFGLSYGRSDNEICRDVTSRKELWEGNENGHSHNSDTVMGMEREPGIYEFFFACGSRQFCFQNRSESEKVFARIFDEIIRCSGLPKTSAC